MYSYADIRRVHLEVTSRCNAACPQCPRNLSGGEVNPELPLVELSLADARQIFTPPFVRQLRQVFMCGNYGDPMVARDTLEIFRWFRECNPGVHLHMITNGSGRDAAWWAQLAQVIDQCTFSVDGLEDTNHIYRRHTRWEKIETAMRSFIGAGGRATWQFIVFRHNEHQLEAARQLSQKLGFNKFVLKKSYRFRQGGVIQERFPVLSKDGELEYYIEMPEAPEWRNDALVSIDALLKKGASWDEYLGSTPVTCKSVVDGEIYVSAEGLVFPCCFTANLYQPGKARDRGQLWQMIERLPGGRHAIDARQHSLEEIVAGPFFQQTFPSGWETKPLASGRLAVCARVCGTYDMQKATRTPSAI
jgi:MoaA/NifB/PqqE/SkfB family radical SAM enzyme